MPEYRKQHWLPASYLQFFDVSGTPRGRESELFVANATACHRRRVSNVAVQSYLYSRDDPESAERSFQAMEADYPRFLEHVLEDRDLSPADGRGLFHILLHLHLRNAAYENRGSGERIEAYGRMGQTFLVRNVAKISREEGQDLDNVMAGIARRWQLTPIRNAGNDPLISSDHPCLLFALADELAFAFLPAHPRLGLLAYDRSLVRVVANEANQQDAATLNTLQAMVCQREVYSFEDLTSEVGEGRPLTRFLTERAEQTRGWATDHEWSPEFVSYPQTWMPAPLSFIRLEAG